MIYFNIYPFYIVHLNIAGLKGDNLLMVSLSRLRIGLGSARNVHFNQLLLAADETSVFPARMLVLVVDEHGMAVASPQITLHCTNEPL